MPTVSIDGDASGAIAACAAAQAAIDALHGKTVTVDINVRQHGGGMGEATRGMQDFGQAADRAGRSTRGMGDDLGRSAGHARGMADHMHRAGGELERASRLAQGMGNELERGSGHMGAIAGHAEVVRGAIGSGASSMRSIGSGAASAGRDMRALESGASRAGLAMRNIVPSGGVGGGGLKNDIIDMHKLADGTYGVAEGMRAIGSAQKAAGSASGGGAGGFSWAGVNAGDIGYTGPQPQDRSGRSSDAAEGRRSPTADRMRDLRAAADDVAGGLGNLPGAAMPSARALMGVGLGAGVATLGIAALGAAVAGVGLAGVGEVFAHNNQLMHAGGQAVRGFNREFVAMRGETSAAGSGPMAGLATSMKGVGHELAAIGAANIAPVLNSVSSLGNQATQAMQKLAPSIGPATQGLTALAGAVLGAFGDSGPAVTSFANTLTQAAPGMQALTSDIISTGGAIGNAVVGTLGGMGRFDQFGLNQERDPIAPFSDPSPAKGGVLGQVLTNTAAGRRPMDSGGDEHTAAPVSRAGVGLAPTPRAPMAAAGAAPVAPGAFDPSKPFSGQLANDNAGTSFTSGTGDGAAPKPSGAAKRSLGNFDSKGAFGLPTSPSIAGRSPDSAKYDGMTGAQIYAQQYHDSTGVQPGKPMYNGLGPRGGGQSVGPMPSNIASGLGGGGIGGGTPVLSNMMQAAQAQVAGGGGATGASMIKHIQKAVDVAGPAAAAGGAAVGGALGGGMAQGTSSSMSVVDTVMIKHTKHIIDVASAGLGVHSPSTEFDYLGRMTSHGYAQGVERESHRAASAMTGLFGQGGHKFGYDNQDIPSPTVSFNPRNPVMGQPDEGADPMQHAADWRQAQGNQQGQFQPGSNAWWAAHDNRAGELRANRAANHERALSQIGAVNKATGERYQDPRQADVNRFTKAPTPGLWERLNSTGPQDGKAGLKNVFRPDAQQNPALPRVGPGSSGAMMSQLTASKLGIGGLPNQLNKAGQLSAQGLHEGMSAHVGKIHAAGSNLAGAGHSGYRKKDKQASPSAEWAAMAGNSAAGAVQGMNAGAPAMAAAAMAAAGTMADVVGGYLPDRGLMAGYSYAQNLLTGVETVIKKTDYQSQGIPQLASQAATAALASTGLLRAGSGAQSYKTPGNTPGVVTLAPSSSSGADQTLTINHNIVHDDGHISQVATVVTLDMFGKLKDAQAVQAR